MAGRGARTHMMGIAGNASGHHRLGHHRPDLRRLGNHRFGHVVRAAVIGVVIASAGLSHAGAADETPRFATETCRRVTLIDAHTDELVIGIEDIAFDPMADRLYLSAFDRRAVERAVSARATDIPQGGLYSVPHAALFETNTDALRVEPVIDRSVMAGGLRPHGLDLDFGAREIVFINRAFQKIDGTWRQSTQLARFSFDGAVGGVDHAAQIHCAGNDVISASAIALLSFDHAACGRGRFSETVFGLRRSGIIDTHGHTLFDGALFANGLVDLGGGRLALAATREKTVRILTAEGANYTVYDTHALPGGPDNLSLAADGTITAALHPDLVRLALHRKLGKKHAPSRIVALDPKSGAVDILYDDPSGRQFTAATVGLNLGDHLVAGSATDAGLLVCDRARASVNGESS